MSKNKPEGLTEEQQRLFEGMTSLQQGMAINTIKGMKPADAHEAAGGTCKTEKQRKDLGNQILSKPIVKEFIALSKQEAAIEAQVDATYILNAAKAIHDRCIQEVTPVMRAGEHIQDEDGNPLYTFDAKAALQALKLMGDHVDVSAFKKVIEHTAGEGISFNMSFGGKSDE